jgi:hypothetical protein
MRMNKKNRLRTDLYFLSEEYRQKTAWGRRGRNYFLLSEFLSRFLNYINSYRPYAGPIIYICTGILYNTQAFAIVWAYRGLTRDSFLDLHKTIKEEFLEWANCWTTAHPFKYHLNTLYIKRYLRFVYTVYILMLLAFYVLLFIDYILIQFQRLLWRYF